MKITCESCGAKYTISDEKVRGRTVKIRCKKCKAPIIVEGPPAEPLPPEEEDEADGATRVFDPSQNAAGSDWTVTMPDGSQETVDYNQLVALYQSGEVTDETYVWREGMDDWKTVAEVPELLALQSAANAPGSPIGGPDAQMSEGLFGGGGAVAAVAPPEQEGDLFGAQPESSFSQPAEESGRVESKPPLPGHGFTAERGENSVLFTIDALKAMEKGAPAAPKAATSDEKVDFDELVSLNPPAMDAPGGAVDPFGGAMSPLTAPPVPTMADPLPEPEPEPEPAAAASMAPMMDQQQQGGNKKLIYILGGAVALLFVVVIGMGAYFLTREPPKVASNDSTNSANANKDDHKSDNAKGDKDKDKAEQKTAKSDDSSDEKKDDEDDKSDKGDKDNKEASSSSTHKLTSAHGSTHTSKKTSSSSHDKSSSKKNDKPKKVDKKPEKTEEKPAESKPLGKFSRSAALSALQAAAGAASGCKKPGGPTGRGRVAVTFAPSGRVTTAVVTGPPFAGTSVGGCVAAIFRRARVPPFSGSPVTARKSFTIR